MTSMTICLWFDTEAEEAAQLYTSIFGGTVTDTQRYGEAGPGEPGSVMTVSFEAAGMSFVGLNGGPAHAQFTEAISVQVHCESQELVDEYWARLTEGGEEGPCGWLKDQFGLSWQIIPDRLTELLGDPNPERSSRAMQAMFAMTKIDVPALEKAAAGG
jgi:predicted 3-demethylubiquinone-9 3-methyltransferase (glyoxalase superfamily)